MRFPCSTIRLLSFSLVAGALWSVSVSEVQASCGDYLHVKGEPVAGHVMRQPQEDAEQRPHQMPSPCLNGQCGIPPHTPTPSGTTSDTLQRIEIRVCSILDELVDWTDSRATSSSSPTDENAPATPHLDRLDKPPQFTFV